jgi:hypothetical protein
MHQSKNISFKDNETIGEQIIIMNHITEQAITLDHTLAARQVMTKVWIYKINCNYLIVYPGP